MYYYSIVNRLPHKSIKLMIFKPNVLNPPFEIVLLWTTEPFSYFTLPHTTSNYVNFFNCSTVLHLSPLSDFTDIVLVDALITLLGATHSQKQTHLINTITAFPTNNHTNCVTIFLACPTYTLLYLCPSWPFFHFFRYSLSTCYVPSPAS